MIGRIVGLIAGISPPQVLVDVNGISYEIDLPTNDCANLPTIGEKITLYTHLVVREDAHILFGFLNLQNRDCFRGLLRVSGIGPKIALALLSTLTAQELSVAIYKADVTALCRAPGIGKKVAERMVLELKGKLPDFEVVVQHDGVASKDSLRLDIANALMGLGYKNAEINLAIRALPNDIPDLSTGIKVALQLM